MTSINQQQQEAATNNPNLIDVYKFFYTIQGEGPFAGSPSIFLRLAGCNIRCPGCDTIYTGDERRTYSVAELVDAIVAMKASEASAAALIVVTGGEPLRQNLDYLLPQLGIATKLHEQIETTGILPLSDTLIQMCLDGRLSVVVSPKTSRISRVTAQYADAFKYVLEAGNSDRLDGLPLTALGHKASPSLARPLDMATASIFVNPMDEKDPERNSANMQAVIEVCMKYGYTAGAQLHKMWDVE